MIFKFIFLLFKKNKRFLQIKISDNFDEISDITKLIAKTEANIYILRLIIVYFKYNIKRFKHALQTQVSDLRFNKRGLTRPII